MYNVLSAMFTATLTLVLISSLLVDAIEGDLRRWKKEIPRGFPSKSKNARPVNGGFNNQLFPYPNYFMQPPIAAQPPIVYLIQPPPPPKLETAPPLVPIPMARPVPPIVVPPPPPVIVPQPPIIPRVLPVVDTTPIITKPTTTTAFPTTTGCPVTEAPPEVIPSKVNCPPENKFCLINTDHEGVRYSIVNRHNNARKLISATNMLKMQWDDSAAKVAQVTVDQCTDTPQANALTGGFFCNENIFKTPTLFIWEALIARWNIQRKQFKYGTNNPATKEYSNMITADASLIGAAFKNCGPKGYFYVIAYCHRGTSNSNSPAKPYIEGTKCSACKCHCENNLCLKIG